MCIRRSIFLAFVIMTLSLPAFAQNAVGEKDLIHELNTIKAELNNRNTKIESGADSSQLMQKVTELSQQLDIAQKKIKALEEELKNRIQNSSTNPDKNLTFETKLNQYTSKDSVKPVNTYEVSYTNDYKKQLDLSTNTIVEQARQLSRAYEEIEKYKNASLSSDKLVNNLILQADKLHLNGKDQEAIAVYEILDKIGIKNPKIYQNLALIYQGLGMAAEADKQYNKLYFLFPSLKGSAKVSDQKK